jgi:hypothetical protein
MARNKKLSPRISPSRKKPSMGLFLDSQETLLVIKYPFRKAGTNISKQPTARGRAKKKAPKNLVYQKKSIRIRAEKNNIKGILICESTKRNYLSVAKS